MAGNQPVIVIKKKKGGRHPHHGGAWKVAYADFVTAMMAFFLLLWLLNVTTDIQRKGIADYFAPASISSSQSGASGMFGGQTLNSKEAKMSDTSPINGASDTMPPPPGADSDGDKKPGSSRRQHDEKEDIEAPPQERVSQADIEQDLPQRKALDELDKKRAAEEQEKFKQVEFELKQVLAANPELSGLSKSLIMDITDEGLRIQIVDQENYSMFPTGSAQMYPPTRRLLELVGKAIQLLPNRIAISGHTDNVPFSANSTRDNWDLSAERANASRRVLAGSGINADRIQNVVGRADREPLDTTKANDPKNRRISIVLLRQSLFDKKDNNKDAAGKDDTGQSKP